MGPELAAQQANASSSYLGRPSLPVPSTCPLARSWSTRAASDILREELDAVYSECVQVAP